MKMAVQIEYCSEDTSGNVRQGADKQYDRMVML